MARTLSLLLLTVLMAGFYGSCGEKQERPAPLSPSSPINPDSITYDRHVRPIIERHCAECHILGASGGVKLDTYDRVKSRIDLIITVTETGYMPKTGPRLTGEQVDTLKAWKLGNAKP